MTAATHALLVLAGDASFDGLAPVVEFLAGQGLEPTDHRVLPVPRRLASRRSCQVLTLAGSVDRATLAPLLDQLGGELQVDLVLQSQAVRQADYRLAVFDMDSTLIDCEVIDELASRHGVGEQVAAVTERAMRGELDFNASFAERLARLEGLDGEVVADIAANLPFTDGVRELIPTLRARGIRTAILSGGFEPFARRLQEELGFDEIHANRLDMKNGRLTGVVVPPIVNGARKAELMAQIREQHGLDPSQVIAVGDGANDLPMLSRAGMGIAYRAKPIVRAQADYNIRHVGLDGITCLLGAPSEVDSRRP